MKEKQRADIEPTMAETPARPANERIAAAERGVEGPR